MSQNHHEETPPDQPSKAETLDPCAALTPEEMREAMRDVAKMQREGILESPTGRTDAASGKKR